MAAWNSECKSDEVIEEILGTFSKEVNDSSQVYLRMKRDATFDKADTRSGTFIINSVFHSYIA